MELREAALRWLYDLLAHGIMITDAELNICGWNHWLETHSGQDASHMIGRNLLDAYPDLGTRRLNEYYIDALNGQVRIISQRLHGYLLAMPPGLDSSTFLHMQQSARIAPLLEGDRVIGTITVIDDATERVEREHRLVELLAKEKAARAEAETASRAKDEFLAVVSHELRTPLNSILGWAQLLRTNKFDEAASSHGLETIENNAKAQATLIEDILDASRIVTGKLRLEVRPVDLAPIVESVVETARPAADAKSIQITSAIDAWAGLVSGDPNRLQQVIWNLLFNAIKFTPKGGRVEVRLQRNDSHVEITVSDTGQGISPEFLPHVFDRFRQDNSTSARKYGGLGLGLAIVRHFAELHGGTVSAQSEGEGLGATFSVKLPLMAVHPVKRFETGALAEAEPEFTKNPAEGSYDDELEDLRVLVVDNESDAREILDITLTQRGAKVMTATTSREALKVLQEWMPDVLVSDIGMPEEDGYTLISKIRALDPDHGGRTPAVALTGYAGPDERRRLLSAGYQLHVTKPVELNELISAIADLSGRTPKNL